MIQSKGGTEILKESLLNRLDENSLSGINLINGLTQNSIKSDHINILWNHHSYDQPIAQSYLDKKLLDQVQYFIYVSNWQYEKYRYYFSIPEDRSLVIKNAIEPIELKKKPEKVRLIYTSTPWRGLDILLEAFSLLNRDDVELDIYSSTIIYGTRFYEENDHRYKKLFDLAENMNNVNYRGYASNGEIRSALLEAHIFAYPCIWEETSCLSAIEAGMSGLSIVTTNLGALYETVNSWGRLVSYDSTKKNLVRKFAFALNLAIDEFWNEDNQLKLKEQHKYFSRFYSWNNRINEWTNLISQIKR